MDAMGCGSEDLLWTIIVSLSNDRQWPRFLSERRSSVVRVSDNSQFEMAAAAAGPVDSAALEAAVRGPLPDGFEEMAVGDEICSELDAWARSAACLHPLSATWRAVSIRAFALRGHG